MFENKKMNFQCQRNRDGLIIRQARQRTYVGPTRKIGRVEKMGPTKVKIRKMGPTKHNMWAIETKKINPGLLKNARMFTIHDYL